MSNRLRCIAPTLALLALLAACRASGHHEVDATSTRLDELRSSVVALRGKADATAESLALVVELADAGPQKAFERYESDVRAMEKARQDARSRLSRAETEARRLFEGWARNLDDIGDPGIRELSEERRAELSAELDKVLAAMHAAMEELDAFVSTSQDLRTYLAQDLTPAGVLAIRGRSRDQTRAARTIGDRLDDVIAAAERAAPRFATAKPPPPAR